MEREMHYEVDGPIGAGAFYVTDAVVKVGSHPEVHTVYAVRSMSDWIYFLFYENGGWGWKDSKHFIPLKSPYTLTTRVP